MSGRHSEDRCHIEKSQKRPTTENDKANHPPLLLPSKLVGMPFSVLESNKCHHLYLNIDLTISYPWQIM